MVGSRDVNRTADWVPCPRVRVDGSVEDSGRESGVGGPQIE